jgi:hypothetical protein
MTRIRTKIILSLWALSLGAYGVAEGQVHLEAILETPETPFHQPATYTLVVDAPEDMDVTLPNFDGDIEGLEIREGATTMTSTGKGRQEIRHSFVLDPVEIKTYLLPSLTVSWGEGEEAAVPPMVFKVRDLTESEKEMALSFAGLIGPQALSARSSVSAWIWTLLFLVVLVVAAVVGWRWWRRAPQEKFVPETPAWNVALSRLRELAKRNLAESGKYEPYYVDLSAILRYYIEDRFQLHAPEQTTPEFLESSSESELISESQEENLSELLRHFDRVKFARYEPSTEEMKQSFSVVEQFVEETIPALVEEEAA